MRLLFCLSCFFFLCSTQLAAEVSAPALAPIKNVAALQQTNLAIKKLDNSKPSYFRGWKYLAKRLLSDGIDPKLIEKVFNHISRIIFHIFLQ